VGQWNTSGGSNNKIIIIGEFIKRRNIAEDLESVQLCWTRGNGTVGHIWRMCWTKGCGTHLEDLRIWRMWDIFGGCGIARG